MISEEKVPPREGDSKSSPFFVFLVCVPAVFIVLECAPPPSLPGLFIICRNGRHGSSGGWWEMSQSWPRICSTQIESVHSFCCLDNFSWIESFKYCVCMCVVSCLGCNLSFSLSEMLLGWEWWNKWLQTIWLQKKRNLIHSFLFMNLKWLNFSYIKVPLEGCV